MLGTTIQFQMVLKFHHAGELMISKGSFFSNDTFLKKTEMLLCLAVLESWFLTSEVPPFKRNLVPGLLPSIYKQGLCDSLTVEEYLLLQ